MESRTSRLACATASILLAASLSFATQIGDLTDVSLVFPAAGQCLLFTGTANNAYNGACEANNLSSAVAGILPLGNLADGSASGMYLAAGGAGDDPHYVSGYLDADGIDDDVPEADDFDNFHVGQGLDFDYNSGTLSLESILSFINVGSLTCGGTEYGSMSIPSNTAVIEYCDATTGVSVKRHLALGDENGNVTRDQIDESKLSIYNAADCTVLACGAEEEGTLCYESPYSTVHSGAQQAQQLWICATNSWRRIGNVTKIGDCDGAWEAFTDEAGQVNPCGSELVYEGMTPDDNETRLRFDPADPTSDYVVTIPNETGTICTTGSVCTGYAAAGSGLHDIGDCSGMPSCFAGDTTGGSKLIWEGSTLDDYETVLQFSGNPTSDGVITIPNDVTGTMCVTGRACENVGNGLDSTSGTLFTESREEGFLYYATDGSDYIAGNGSMAVDTTADQLLYGGAGGAVVLSGVNTSCAILESLAATDDNYDFFEQYEPVTIIAVGCNCRGTCSTPATFTLEDRGGNAMTIDGTNPTCSTTGATSYAEVTAGGALVSGEGARFDVTNTPTAGDTYKICVVWVKDVQ